jgi:hypothetical protein
MRQALLHSIMIAFIASSAVYAQTVRRIESEPVSQPCRRNETATVDTVCADQIARALNALEQLRNDVLIYRSRAEFEDNRKLARVSLQTFSEELAAVSREFEPLLLRLPQGDTKSALLNALDSFRDGVFWWQKTRPSGLVHITALRFEEMALTPSNADLMANAPYTVTMYWRLADRYLRRASKLMAGRS